MQKMKKNDREKYKWLVKQYIQPYKLYLLILIFFIFVGSSVAGITPYLYGKMLDAITLGDLDLLKWLILAYLGINIGTNLMSLLEGTFGRILNFKLAVRVQKKLFSTIIRMRTSAYSKYESGELMSRLNGDAEGIISFTINLVTSLLHIGINLAWSIYFIFKISMILSTVALFYIPAYFILTFMLRKHYRTLAEKQKKFGDSFFSFESQVFQNNTGIKSFKVEKQMDDRYAGFMQKQYDILKTSIKLTNINQFASSFIMVCSSLFIIYVSAILIKDGLLSIGLMVAFSSYMNKFFDAVAQLFGLNISFQTVMVSVDRIYHMLHEDIEKENDERMNEVTLQGSIQFKHLDFRYPNANEFALSDLSFEISKNGFYSVVGPNGCGKSTLSKLLIKLYDSNAGLILINGVNLNDISYGDLRGCITYVQKEEFFLNESIINNLKLGSKKVTDEQVIACCRKLGIDSFVESLPLKYESFMGEGGALFSSGQKQKLSLARAILRQSPIYIFDEITANLDGKSEKEIMKVLHDLSHEAVVIFISHNVFSIKDSDVIFLMEQGQVVNSGTHVQLLGKDPLYQRLFQEQGIKMQAI